MSLSISTEPQQGATHRELARLARHAEECGFEAFFRSDHLMHVGPVDPGVGSSDAWLTLAALAAQTSRIRLGTIVSPVTFRSPGHLAIIVAQVDEISGGRVELGIGAGWYEAEHLAYGIPFPPRAERFERWEEQLKIITGLWTTPAGEKFGYEGKHYRIVDSPALPKPTQAPHPPIIVGGRGPKKTPRMAALYADEYNVAFAPLDLAAHHIGLAREACEMYDRAGTGRGPLRFSLMHRICCGRNDEELARRAASFGATVEQVAERGILGTPEEVAKQLTAYKAVGVERFLLQVLDYADLDHLDLLASEVFPLLD